MKNLCFVLFLLLMLMQWACKPTQVSKEQVSLENLKDGVYQGSASGINKATVQVQIENHRIKDLKLIKLEATPFGQKAKDSIPARMLERQSALVDAVSGATEASNTIMNATVDALKKAQGE